MLNQSPKCAPETNLPRPAYLAHIVLRTGQPKALIEWYKSVLNATVAHSNDQVTFLTYDDEHHRIAIATMPVLGKRPLSRAGVDHVAFTYASLNELLQHHQNLDAIGIRPIWSVNHGPTTSLYYRDPDRNVIELQVDNFSTEAELTNMLNGLDFKENPIGVDFDPAKLKARLDAGEDPRSLTMRPKIGPRSATTLPAHYLGGVATFAIKLAKLFGVKV